MKAKAGYLPRNARWEGHGKMQGGDRERFPVADIKICRFKLRRIHRHRLRHRFAWRVRQHCHASWDARFDSPLLPELRMASGRTTHLSDNSERDPVNIGAQLRRS
jgi:hypothetical protein